MKRMRNQLSALVVAGLALALPAAARQVVLDVALTNPLLLSDTTQRVYLKVGLTGFERETPGRRAPLNLALVIDKSGSMQGERIRQAREAALYAIGRLRPEDVVSVIAFDHNVQVLVPATHVSDLGAIRRGIERLEAGGTTAIFAGVSKGSDEVRRYIDRERVNRVILLSDGQANVGPSSPGALGELGASLRREGIAVTTIGLGLGYNEDLMVRLARESDGNHAFVEHSNDLVRIFDREFDAVSAVVAQEIEVRIRCSDAVRPLRVLGRDAQISGQTVVTSMNQLYSGQERYVMLEVEVSPQRAGHRLAIADVDVAYRNLDTAAQAALKGRAEASITTSEAEVEARLNREVMSEAVLQRGVADSRRAVELRDEGRADEAQQVLRESASSLRMEAGRLGSDSLRQQADQVDADAEVITAPAASWAPARKRMREAQYSTEAQTY